MRINNAETIGIDLLCELSVGWYLTEHIDSSGFYVEYRNDGSTPVNILNTHTWLDEKQDIVRRADFVDYTTQIPLPIVSYDLVNDSGIPMQLGTSDIIKEFDLTIIVHAETKAQLINLANFIESLLRYTQIPILNYNVVGNPQVGVISCRDIYKARLYNLVQNTNLAEKISISISCSANAEYDNDLT